MNYYEEIKNIIENREISEKVRRLKSNKDTLNVYYKIGKLLVDAQGGEKRAKYGDRLIKEWSVKLVEKYGKGYDSSNLRRMRQYYLIGEKCGPVAHKLTWTHWNILLPIKNENERNYYINQCILNNLSKRELIRLIKEKAFDRLSYVDKSNIKLIDLKEKNNNYSLRNMILFNINLNCYIAVELKLKNTTYKDISQIQLYRKLVDDNIKKNFHDKTIGLIISKKNDKFILEYVNDDGVYLISCEVNELIGIK